MDRVLAMRSRDVHKQTLARPLIGHCFDEFLDLRPCERMARAEPPLAHCVCLRASQFSGLASLAGGSKPNRSAFATA